MRMFYAGLALLLVPLYGAAQNTVFDTLDHLLPPLGPEQKFEIFQQLRDLIEAEAVEEKRVLRAHLLRNYAIEQEDTLILRLALGLLGDIYRAKGDTVRARQFVDRQKDIASSFGWAVANGYRREEPYFGYQYSTLFSELQVLVDPRGQFTVEMLDRPEVAAAFADNETDSTPLDRGAAYWLKMKLRGHPYEAGDYIFMAGSGEGPGGAVFGWDTVDVFVRFHADSMVTLRTGTALSPAEKPITDACDFFPVALGAGESATLLLRLKGPHGDRLFLRFVDPATLLEWEGFRPRFRFPGHDPQRDYGYYPVSHSLEVVEDKTGALDFGEVWETWPVRSRTNAWVTTDWDQVFWVKLRLFGSSEQSGDLLFEVLPAQAWRHIDVYWPNAEDQYVHQWAGTSQPLAARPVPHWRNLFNYRLLPGDTTDVYLRLEGYRGDPSIRAFTIGHVDERAFWPGQSGRGYLYGFLLGLLGFQILYFLFQSWLDRRPAPFFYALFLAGLALATTFAHPADFGAFLLPGRPELYPLLRELGAFLAVFGLVASIFFIVRRVLRPGWRIVVIIFLSLWLVAVFLRVGEQEGWWALGVGVLPVLEYCWCGLAVLGLGLAFLFSLAGSVKGLVPAYYLLAGLVVAGLCGILALVHFLVYGSLGSQDPMFYLTAAGGVLGMVFIGLGVNKTDLWNF